MAETWAVISCIAAVVSAAAAAYANRQANRREAKQEIIDQINTDLRKLATQAELKALHVKDHANNLFQAMSEQLNRIAETADMSRGMKAEEVELKKQDLEAKLKGCIEPSIVSREGKFFLQLHNSGLGEARKVHISIREAASNNHIAPTRPQKAAHDVESILPSATVECDLGKWGPVPVRADWYWINRNNEKDDQKNEVVPYVDE